MKNNFAISVLVFLLFASLLSCGKKTTEPTDEFGVEDFPTSIGFQWTYEVHDSLTGVTDTVTVAITDTLTLAGVKPATIWVYTYIDAVDTQYVAVVSDTVAIYASWDTSVRTGMYIFPLEVGKHWSFGRGSQSFTSNVVEKDSNSVPAGTFPNAFHVETEYVVLNGFARDSTWLAPNVGTVRMHRIGSLWFEQTNQTWELLSYDLNLAIHASRKREN